MRQPAEMTLRPLGLYLALCWSGSRPFECDCDCDCDSDCRVHRGAGSMWIVADLTILPVGSLPEVTVAASIPIFLLITPFSCGQHMPHHPPPPAPFELPCPSLCRSPVVRHLGA